MSFKMFALKSVCILYLVSLVCGEYPKPENIYPCILSSVTNVLPNIICNGKEIKDLDLLLNKNLKSSEGKEIKFGSISIENTSITSIGADIFGDATFQAIFIKSNTELTKIDPKAFKKIGDAQIVSVFDLFDSPNYVNSEELFNVINNLRVNDKIGLTNVGIKEIPDNAFKSNPTLKYIIVTNNAIKRIGKSAFTALSSLKQLILPHNNISEIDTNGLTFDLSNADDKEDIYVLLVSNLLTDKSFHENWSNSKEGKRKIKIIFALNKIEALPEAEFKSVVLSPTITYLDFGGSRMTCDCRMKYLFDIKDKVEENVIGILCNTHSNKLIWTLNGEDFKCLR